MKAGPVECLWQMLTDAAVFNGGRVESGVENAHFGGGAMVARAG